MFTSVSIGKFSCYCHSTSIGMRPESSSLQGVAKVEYVQWRKQFRGVASSGQASSTMFVLILWIASNTLSTWARSIRKFLFEAMISERYTRSATGQRTLE